MVLCAGRLVMARNIAVPTDCASGPPRFVSGGPLVLRYPPPGMVKDAIELKAARPLTPSAQRTVARKAQFLDVYATAPSRKAALSILSEGHQTVDRWRETDHEFALNYLKVERDKARGRKTGKTIPFDPFRETPEVPGLVEFRRRVFGFPSTPTQTAFAQAWDDKTNLYIFWQAPAGPQPLSATVYRPDGPAKLGDLEVEDLVAGPDGAFTRVTRIEDHPARPIWEVETKDGSVARSADTHNWPLAVRRTRAQPRTLPSIAADLWEHSTAKTPARKWRIANSSPVEYPARVLPIDPWLMGMLLGDGCFRQNTTKITSADPEIPAMLQAVAPPGVKVTSNGIQHRLSGYRTGRYPGGKRSIMLGLLGEAGFDGCGRGTGPFSHEKLIPPDYLVASTAQRTALLQGLMDSDGYVDHKGGCSFTSHSPQLRDGLIELVRSLGGQAWVSYTDTRKGRPGWDVWVKTPFNPFRLPRKAVRWRNHLTPRIVIRVEEVGFEPVRCITVAAPHHQYLTDGYLPTHNSGKDVTAMQAVAQAAAAGMEKMGCVMENEKQAKKRIDSYLDPYFTDHSVYTRAPNIPGGMNPETDFIDQWGPWKYDSKLRLPDGTQPPPTKWDAYHKWFVGRTTPQADPSLWALGIESSIAGSRQQLLVMSDLFTTENQRSAAFRRDQFEAITGTLDARLDARGRLVILNHHVRQRGESNLVRMEEQFIGSARVVHQEGDYTKYANGVAVIRTPALRSEDGVLVSYWPEMFPVEAQLELPDGQHIPAADLTDAEHETYTAQGARRIRGLLDRKQTAPELFQLHYQQNPESQGFGDFTQEALEAAFDNTRTLGISLPTETLLLSVDPARQGGCAWTVLGLDMNDGTTTLIDFWIGERLGFSGMRDKLIKVPVELYRPVDLVWEDNYEGETPEHPEAREVLARYHVRYVPWHTHLNRSEGDYAVMKMRDDMNKGLIRFPGATPADRMRCQDLFDHFRNFEQAGYLERKHSSGARRLHDDGCLAFWMGWAHGKVLVRTHKRPAKRVSMTADAIRNAFSGYKVN